MRYGYGYNPELLTIMNPAPRGHRRHRVKRSNPPLKKKVGKSYLTFQQLVEKELHKATKGKKFRSGKAYFAVRKRARDRARRTFKKGYVFHRGMKLKIVGWVGQRKGKS